MNSLAPFAEPLPGIFDGPLAPVEDLPDPDIQIPPLKDPRPARSVVPSPLEPSAGRKDIQNGAKIPSRQHALRISADPSHLLAERTVKPTDINSLIDPIPNERAQQNQLPSFVSLATIENKPPPFNNDNQRKRMKLDFGDLLTGTPLQRPKQPEPEKRKETTGYIPIADLGILQEPQSGPAPPPSIPQNVTSLSVFHVAEPADVGTLDLDKLQGYSDDTSKVSGTDNGLPVKKPRRQVRKWTDDETKRLMDGVNKHGIGRWKEILEDETFGFGESKHRTAVDLKDRYRVCCESYRRRSLNNATLEYSPNTPPPPEASSAVESEGARMRVENILTSNPAVLAPSMVASRDAFKPQDEQLHMGEMDSEAPESMNAIALSESTDNMALQNDKSASGRRRRRLWNKAEDDNLQKGIAEYGYAWTKIREDEKYQLSHRKATDLRDRVRNLFPEEYKTAGFRPVKSKHINMAMRAVPQSDSTSDTGNTSSPVVVPSSATTAAPTTTSTSLSALETNGPTTPPALPSSQPQVDSTRTTGTLSVSETLNPQLSSTAVDEELQLPSIPTMFGDAEGDIFSDLELAPFNFLT